MCAVNIFLVFLVGATLVVALLFWAGTRPAPTLINGDIFIRLMFHAFVDIIEPIYPGRC